MSFYNPNYLYLFFFLVGLLVLAQYFKTKNYLHYFSPYMQEMIFKKATQTKINLIILICAFLFFVMALSRPIIKNDPIIIQQEQISFVVAFDISKSMLSNDISPNRLLFAKQKFHYLLTKLKEEKIGVIGFSNISYLISPITNEHTSLKYLVDNLNTNLVDTRGSNLFSVLKGAQKLLQKEEKKVVIVFTDGTEQSDFTKEIAYAKEHDIKVFIYAIGTKKGSSIEDKNGVLFDKRNNIVISKLGEKCVELALYSDGAYLESSNDTHDIDRFLEVMRGKFDDKEIKEYVVSNNLELFQIPLFLAIVFLFFALFDLRRRR